MIRWKKIFYYLDYVSKQKIFLLATALKERFIFQLKQPLSPPGTGDIRKCVPSKEPVMSPNPDWSYNCLDVA